MPRKSKSRAKKSRSSVVRVPFYNIITLTTTTGTGVGVSVSPNTSLSARLAAMADVYDEYRFVNLKYRMHRGSVLNFYQSTVFLPGIVDTLPTTPTLAAESPHCSLLYGLDTVPTAWQSVPRSLLSGSSLWYKTVPGSPDPSVEIQGVLAYATTGAAEGGQIEVHGVCEFQSPVGAGSTPALRAQASRERERAYIIGLLQSSPPTPGAKMVLTLPRP
jgi:hypothetical protein